MSQKPRYESKPDWIRMRLPSGQKYADLKEMFADLKLATVCQESLCPNISECWSGGTATLMLMGEVCTRGCRFCHVKTGNPKGVLDLDEPNKVAYALSQMDLKYVVLTSVDRDDLEDEGSGHFSKTVSLIKQTSPQMLVETLTPDFKGKKECVEKLVRSGVDVYAHNIETVAQLQKKVRDPRANYEQSLFVLKTAKEVNPDIYTKSSLMLGLGETDQQIRQTLSDLRSVGCDVITFGQYLQPTKRHLKVAKFVTPEKFEDWKQVAEKEFGFLYCASGPMVRSSYRAAELFLQGIIKKNAKGEKIHAGN